MCESDVLSFKVLFECVVNGVGEDSDIGPCPCSRVHRTRQLSTQPDAVSLLWTQTIHLVHLHVAFAVWVEMRIFRVVAVWARRDGEQSVAESEV
eukprot:jgi/Antlo1/1691/338